MTEKDTIDITTRSQLQTRQPRIPPAPHRGTQLDPQLPPQPGYRKGGPQTYLNRPARRADVRYWTLQGVETSGLDWAAK